MDFSTLISNISQIALANLFFKSFAVLLSFTYLIYAIVLVKQTQIMNDTLKVGRSSIIKFISTLHIFFGLLLLLMALFFL